MTRPAPARIAALNGGRSTARSSRSPTRDAHGAEVGVGRRRTEAGEVLGRGGHAAGAQPAREGRPEARAAAATVKPKPRPSACRALSGRTTSTTGARSTFMPAARSVAAVARPSARATDGRPVAAIAGALRDGAPGRRCTLPPSWSTMSSSGARTAGRPRDAPQRPRERAHLRRRAEVGAQEDDARRLAAADAREQRRAARVRPANGKTTCWPASCASVSRGRGRAAGEPAAFASGLGSDWSRRPLGSSLAPQAASARATAASAAARALTARSWSPRSAAARPRR